METVVRVFDIPEFFQEEATDERKNDFALELIAAFTNVGFIYVRSDTVTEEELLAVNSVSLQYFNESLELKQLLLSRDRAKRGYSPFGTENFASLVGEIKPNDLVEKLRVGPEFDHSDTYYSTKLSRSHFSENIWNESFPTLRSVVTRYYHSMEILALQILEIIGYGLGYTAQYFEKKMDKHTSILTINHYPKNSSSLQSDRVRVAEHTDVSMITIVNQCPPTSCQSDYGLQILSSELEWVDVPHIPGMF